MVTDYDYRSYQRAGEQRSEGTPISQTPPMPSPLWGTPVDRAWVKNAHRILTLAAFRDAAPQQDEVVSLSDHIAKLLRWWHRDTDGYSLFEQKQRHEAYQTILSYREKAVRYMLEDLRDNDGFWYVALHEITGAEPPIPDGYTTDFFGEREAWLQWSRQQDRAV